MWSMFFAVFKGAGFIFQVFMCRQGFTSKYTTGTKFRWHFYMAFVWAIYFIFCRINKKHHGLYACFFLIGMNEY